MSTPIKTLGETEWVLPPLILHPFNERVPPSTLLENSKAALMLSGLMPSDGSDEDELKRRLIITLNMTRVVQHIGQAIRFENAERLEPVFDRDHPICSTGEMRTWYTGKPCAYTKRSHINVCVYDSTWEAADAFQLDESPHVTAWAKNDHLGFEVLYIDRGVVRKYRPDFLIRLATGDMLVLETKGQDSEQDRVKRRYLDEWVQAVNAQGGFGRWRWDVAMQPGDILDILARHTAAA